MKNSRPSNPASHCLKGCALLAALIALQGCTVIAIADTVGTVAVKTVALAADATIGVVKLSGKAIGAVLPGEE
jgi:hypothetical protein